MAAVLLASFVMPCIATLDYTARSFLPPDLAVRLRSRPDALGTHWKDAPFRLAPLPIVRQLTNSLPRFRRSPVPSSNEVALADGSASETVFFVFEPEPGKTIADYSFSMSSSNEKTLLGEDFTIGAIQSIGNQAYNVTANIDFTRWVGISDIGIIATDKNTSVTTTSTSTKFTVVGVTFYREDENGNTTIVGGPSRPLKLTTEEIRNNPNIDLGVFIQYPDGTDSSESLNAQFPMNALKITPVSVEQQLSHDSSTCAETGNNFNGSDVLLGKQCGFGFSENDVNGSYVGPKFGLDMNTNRNGSFDLRFEWNALMTGSSLESVGYDTTLNVEVTGESHPIVTTIFPSGPFNSSSDDSFSVIVENLPDNVNIAESWNYNFSIIFANGTIGYATLEPDGIQLNSNSSSTLTFRLPHGSGYGLAWEMTVTKPTGEILPSDDQTEPAYRFNLDSHIRLDSISPSSGSERGGETITLNGEFRNFDPSSGIIYFDGTPIPSTSIFAFDVNQINFTLPAKTYTGYNVSVTVGIDGVLSNPGLFTYIPSTRIDTISPSFGPIAGGTDVVLTGQFSGFNFSDSGVYFGDVQLNSSLITSANDSTIVFATPPKTLFEDSSGIGFNVTVKIKDEVSNAKPFSYQAPLTIDSIVPNSGPEEGGTQVTLSGSFPAFNKEDGDIYFGGLKLNSSNIVSVSNNSIVFTAPARSEIGESSSQLVWVVARNVTSNKVSYNYWGAGASVEIIPNGGGFDGSTGRYVMGPCGNTDYRVAWPKGAYFQTPVYSWTLVDVTTEENILEGTDIVTNEEILVLPYTVYAKKNTNYLLTLIVKTDFVASLQRTITLVQTDVPRIGVHIVDPRPVSFSRPNITLTIPAIISLPACNNTDFKINDTSISYVWNFREKSYLFSYLNLTAPKGIVGPTLLGREFQVPQDAMEYGFFGISLTAYLTFHSEVRGSDTSAVYVRPAPLIAQINGGESSQLISELQDLRLSAGHSRDPDVLVGDKATGLKYQWTCLYSSNSTFTTNTTCGDTLLSTNSSQNFTVSKSSLARIRSDSQNTYVQYWLIVRKVSLNATGDAIPRVSSTVSSVFTIPSTAGQKFEKLWNIAITNNQSTLIDRTRVNYYEDVIITPIAVSADSSWEFELVEPSSEASLLSNPSNLIPFYGFYTIGRPAGRYSLGILANKLSPNTVYKFRIMSYRTGFDRNDQIVSFKTVEKPLVTISHTPSVNGSSMNTVFFVAASTNYNGDFKYYFIVTDQYGYEYCVAGCQGSRVARFQLASSGNYTIRCEVFDSLGYTMLASVNSTKVITISPRSPALTLLQMSTLADNSFKEGDHAFYQQYANGIVKMILDTNRTVENAAQASEIVMNITRNIGQITANSVPNTIQSTHYVRTAASLARLSPDVGISMDLQSLYRLVNITQNAISRSPDTAAMQQLEDLLQFYDLTPALLMQLLSPSTTGVTARFTEAEVGSSESRVIWADMFELMKKQITVIAMKNAVCGARQSVRTGAGSKSGNALSLRFIAARKKESPPNIRAYQEGNQSVSVNPSQGQLLPFSVTMAKLCNPEQNLELHIDEDTENEVRFKSCNRIFKNSFRDLLFSVSSTTDYVWLSELKRIETRTPGLVSVSVVQLRSDNTLVEDDTTGLSSCFEIEMPVSTQGDLAKLNVNNGTPIAGVRFSDPRIFGEPVKDSSEYYNMDYKGVVSKINRVPNGTSSYARGRILASNTGIYSIRAIDWGGSLHGIRWTWLIVLCLLLITLLLVIVIVILVYLFGREKEESVPGMLVPVDTDFTYVERDIYGRGTAVEMMEEDGLPANATPAAASRAASVAVASPSAPVASPAQASASASDQLTGQAVPSGDVAEQTSAIGSDR